MSANPEQRVMLDYEPVSKDIPTIDIGILLHEMRRMLHGSGSARFHPASRPAYNAGYQAGFQAGRTNERKKHQ